MKTYISRIVALAALLVCALPQMSFADGTAGAMNLPQMRMVRVPWVVNRAALAFTPGVTGTDSLYIGHASAVKCTTEAINVGTSMYWHASATDSCCLKLDIFSDPNVSQTASNAVDSVYIDMQWSEDGKNWAEISSTDYKDLTYWAVGNSVTGGGPSASYLFCAGRPSSQTLQFTHSGWAWVRQIRFIVNLLSANCAHSAQVTYLSPNLRDAR